MWQIVAIGFGGPNTGKHVILCQQKNIYLWKTLKSFENLTKYCACHYSLFQKSKKPGMPKVFCQVLVFTLSRKGKSASVASLCKMHKKSRGPMRSLKGPMRPWSFKGPIRSLSLSWILEVERGSYRLEKGKEAC